MTPEQTIEALRELHDAVVNVCDPIFTASDGGDMWCSMRKREGAEASVARLGKALAEAQRIIATK